MVQSTRSHFLKVARRVLDDTIEKWDKMQLPPFNCKSCGKLFKPKRGQFIFYDLCDECFAEFDTQRMEGRLNETEHFEDSDEWIKHNKRS